MKQKYSHTECYRILKVKPDCSWEELRKSYKLQIQKWHPDRFEDGSAEKSAADEKIRYLNAAYRQLSEYHRQHGQLPVVEKPVEVKTPTKPAPETSTSARNTQNSQYASTTHPASSVAKKNIKESSKARVYFTLAAVAIFSYILLSQSPTEEPKKEQVNSNTSASEQTEEISQSSAPTQPDKDSYTHQSQANNTSTITNVDNQATEKAIIKDDEFFTYGSSIGEVISIQGTPTKIEGDIWYYGESKVYFYEGEVVKWKRMPGFPLKAQLIITTPGENKKKSNKPIGTSSLFD